MTQRCIIVSATLPPTKLYHTAVPISDDLLLFPLYIVLIQVSYLYVHLRTLTLMYNKLCVYIGARRFTIIVSVHFYDNRGSQYGDK